MDWQLAKEYAQRWYGKMAQFFLFQNLVMYLFACVTAREAVGLGRYIEFLYHCCEWAAR
jgi:hypothetical protein